MKLIKYILISLSVILAALYLCAFLVLPKVINSKNYSSLISETVKSQTNLDLVISSYKVNVSPSLNITLESPSIRLFYPDRKQILDIQNAYVDFSTLALLKKEIKVQHLTAEKVQFSTKILSNGKFSLQEYLEKNLKNGLKSDFTVSDELPSIKINEILVKIKDEKTGQKFKFDGKKLTLSKTLSPEYRKLSLSGNLYCFDEKYFSYKVKVVFPSKSIKDLKFKPVKVSFDNLRNHKITADIDANIRVIKNKKNEVSGYINIDNFVMKSNGSLLPPSYFHFVFNKNKGEMDSKFYTAKKEKALITSKFSLEKNPKIYIKCKTDKISLTNLKPVIISLCDILNIKNNLAELEVTGSAVSDFEVNTDLKTVASRGSLKIINSEIKHKLLPLRITNINADVDFSNDEIKIQKSNLLVNGQPVILNGKIDNKAYGEISMSGHDLSLANLMNSFPMLKPSEDLFVKSGIISFDVKLNGKLEKAVPKITVQVKNFQAENKKDGTIFSADIILGSLKSSSSQKYLGTLKIFNLKAGVKALAHSLYCANVTGDFDENDFRLHSSKITYDKAVLTIDGKIKDYLKKPHADFKLFGTVDTALLKTFLPKGTNDFKLYSKGLLPVGAHFTSDGTETALNVNILAGPDSYLSPVYLKNLKNTLFHLNAIIKNDTITIKEASLCYPPAKVKLSDTLDTSKLKKLINVSGAVNNINNPSFSKLNIVIPQNLYFSLPPVSSAAVKADILLDGPVKAPKIQGLLILNDVTADDIYLKHLELKPKQNIFELKVENMKIENTFLNILAVFPSDIAVSKKINYLNFDAQYLDLNSLMKLSSLLPQAKYSPGNESPFDVQSGKVHLKAAKINRIKLSNLTSDMKIADNVLYLDNLRSNAYGGSIAAKISYNFLYLTTKAVIQARGLDSAAASIDLMPLDSGISGKLNFDSDITMSGMSEESQMKTLKGKADVVITNAQLGQLGRFEHFLHAQNLLSQRLLYASLNSAKRAIAPKNTGYVNSLKGVLTFNNGYIYLSPLTTCGPQMSMYVTGLVNILTNSVDLQILGRVSPDVSDSVGVLGDVTLKNILDEHTTYGPSIAKLFTSYNTELPKIDISKIPALSNSYAVETKNFRVLIEGNPESVQSIKSFTWVNSLGSREAVLKKQNSPQTPQSLQNTPPKTELPKLEESSKTDNAPQMEQDNKPENYPLPPKTSKQKNTPSSNFLDNIPDSFK